MNKTSYIVTHRLKEDKTSDPSNIWILEQLDFDK